MAQAALDSLPQSTLEEKFSALEARFGALEKKYHDLHERTFTLTENSTGESTEVAIPKLHSANENPDSSEDPPEEKETGPKSRVKIIINRPDPESGERKDYSASDPSPVTSQATDTSHAFRLRKNVYEDADDNDGEIDVINPHLWDLLKDLLGHLPNHAFQGPPVTLDSPYEPLILCWEKLQQATKEAPKDENGKQARADLKLLLDTVSSSSGDLKLDKYFKTHDSNKEQKSITFETLWTIFPPGSLVYCQLFQGQDQVLVVQDSLRTWPYFRRNSARERATWSLLCWTYDWDGKMFRRLSLKLEFEYFDGHKPIMSLPYYPFELNEERANIKDNLIKQGVKYRQYCTATQGSRMFDYHGEAIFLKKGFSGIQGDDDEVGLSVTTKKHCSRLLIQDDEGLSRSTFDPDTVGSELSGPSKKATIVESRVMVDFESYFRYGPSVAGVGFLIPDSDKTECECIHCRGNEALKAAYRTRFDEEKSQKGIWEDEQYILCPPRVLGYILNDKQWAQLQVSLLKSIPERDLHDSWSTRLKLADGEKTKDMILNLVKGHGTSDSPRDDGLEVDDIISKKGKGLVILLYGPPGVGKTSTAETVAIAARKPLFAISVADVGTKAKNVESNLAKIFALATSWQAILLIDEADVFLESRGKGITSNTERNALVSVFLRVLEYYQGILVLTTNQIAQFDVAVQSRIHIAIKYINLDEKQTMAIFEGFLNPLAERGLVKDMGNIKEWLQEDVLKMDLDGRQIRNIITSALGLARAQKKSQLEKNDIKTVLTNVKTFKDEFIKQYEKYKTEQQGMIR